MNLGTLLSKYQYNTDNGYENYMLDLAELAYLSANYTGQGKKGMLDLKASLGLNIYEPVKAGNNVTSLRAASNILFGFNLRKIYDKYKSKSDFKEKFQDAESFYRYTMQVIGGYNQLQNKGNSYNRGFPFFGEHTPIPELIFIEDIFTNSQTKNYINKMNISKLLSITFLLLLLISCKNDKIIYKKIETKNYFLEGYSYSNFTNKIFPNELVLIDKNNKDTLYHCKSCYNDFHMILEDTLLIYGGVKLDSIINKKIILKRIAVPQDYRYNKPY
ncbi:MAG: hypothetical protein DI622_14610 [Chryseobacterium sp.]|uniref:hypothetical protein n=1 Tax=Chryseobacterium sp. TaxID=1871047 RepID=UPI000DB4DCCE|nr:hypothetical protein [Chryseobacterium sp.]MPS66744.1 hypothetical protein [Chryseobacterium sp.]PZU13003.1 MAG: hypothetical protein DI622_14610 [Chryseobacterium sp.]